MAEADWLSVLWQECGGYYICPKDSKGKRKGPLVASTGTYHDKSGTCSHYVGDTYFNFAKVEGQPFALDRYGLYLHSKIWNKFRGQYTWILGATMGGICLGLRMALYGQKQFLYPDKKVIRYPIGNQREEYKFEMSRHEIPPKSVGIIVEDVFNNYSSTEQILQLADTADSEVIAIVCAMNRSKHLSYEDIPVISAIHNPIEEYRQDDLRVVDDVRAGNVIWEPKNNWPHLEEIMKSSKR